MNRSSTSGKGAATFIACSTPRGALAALRMLLAVAAACAVAAAAAAAAESIPGGTTPAATFSPAPLETPSAAPSARPQRFNVYLQTTNTQQYHGAFAAAYSGAQSITPQADTAKTIDATLFVGARLGLGTEAYLNAEMDQGFGLGSPAAAKGGLYAGTFGAGGFPSAESYKIGDNSTYSRIQRLFVRQTFDLGGDAQAIDPAANQLGGSSTVHNLLVTAGKFSVVDVFDTNPYAHDPKNDFLNWAIVDMGAFDYPGDSWSYTLGASAELSSARSTFRAGLFQLSDVPGDLAIEKVPFRQFGSVLEFEQRTSFLGGRPGAIKGLLYDDRGYMGSYADALAFNQNSGTPPDTGNVENDKHDKIGGGLNIAQEIAPHVGLFARASAMNGSYEAFDFTEIDRSISGGVSINGGLYRRPNDTIGVAGALDALSTPAQHYFAAGGTGLLIGDGGLSYGGERIVEAYYRLGFTPSIGITLDYQYLKNPGYNTARGPISIFGLRYHAQI